MNTQKQYTITPAMQEYMLESGQTLEGMTLVPMTTAHAETTLSHEEPMEHLLSHRATLALQALGATLAYLLYAFCFGHGHSPWWVRLLIAPVVYGTVILLLKHGTDAALKRLLKRHSLHKSRLLIGLETVLAAFIGVAFFKLAGFVFG